MEISSGFAPKYYRLYEMLREHILSGHLQPNDQCPTEEDLCREYRVSRGTVRKAFDILASEGLVRREQGRGIFVNVPQPSPQPFSLANLSPLQNQSLTTRTLHLGVQPATATVAERLELTIGESVIHVVQLQLSSYMPILYEERYLARSLCPALVNEDIETQSLHWLLIHKYKLPLVRVTHTIEARTTSAQDAERLQMERDRPVFFVDRLTYTTHGERVRPAVWYCALCRGDYYQFRAEFLSSL